MARRRLHKPLLPGLWTGVAALALMGSIGGLFWIFARFTEFSRIPPPQPPPAVAKGK